MLILILKSGPISSQKEDKNNNTHSPRCSSLKRKEARALDNSVFQASVDGQRQR